MKVVLCQQQLINLQMQQEVECINCQYSPYVRLNIKRKRLRKKFLKNPMLYRERLPKKVVKEYTMKKVSESMTKIVNDTLQRQSIARQIFGVKSGLF